MKASNLIAQLQQVIALRGDVEVLRDDADHSSGIAVDTVQYEPEWQDCAGHVIAPHVILRSIEYRSWFDNNTREWVDFADATDVEQA